MKQSNFITTSKPGRNQGLLYKHLCHLSINSFIKSSLVKISVQRRHALMVGDGAFSLKIDYIPISFYIFYTLKGFRVEVAVKSEKVNGCQF